MKKIVSILLLSLLLFNWIGYRLYTFCQAQKVNSRFEAQLDNDEYDASALVAIKIPATHLPYYTNSKSFERVNGQIEIGGLHYNYVKRRIYNDSLELLCIPNQESTKLQLAKDNFFQLINDLQHNGQSRKGDNHPGAVKNFLPDYLVTVNEFQFIHEASPNAKWSNHFNTMLGLPHYLITEQPPDFLS